MSEDENYSISDLRERVARLETDVKWIKETLKKVDDRTWYILATVLAGIAISILLKVI